MKKTGCSLNVNGNMKIRLLNGFIDKDGVTCAIDPKVNVIFEIITAEEYDNLRANGQLHRDDRAASSAGNEFTGTI